MHDTVSAVQEHTLDEHVSILIDPFLEWKHILNFHVHYWQMITVQSRFSDILFSDKSRFSDNFAEDQFFST